MFHTFSIPEAITTISESIRGTRPIVGVMVVLLAAAFGMHLLGFRWTMLVFYLLLLPGLGRRNPVEIVPLALLGSFGAYWLFAVNLGLALPIGPFGI